MLLFLMTAEEKGATEVMPMVATPLERLTLSRMSMDGQNYGVIGGRSCLLVLQSLMQSEIGACALIGIEASMLLTVLIGPEDFAAGAFCCALRQNFCIPGIFKDDATATDVCPQGSKTMMGMLQLCQTLLIKIPGALWTRALD